MDELSIFLAQLFGLYFIIAGLIIMVRRKSLMPAVTEFGHSRALVLIVALVELIAGLAILDTMNHIQPNVSTVCVGMAASMGAVLLSAGEKGKRFALPNAEIMIHQPSGGAEGMASDIEITAKQILRLRERLNKILAKNTGQKVEKVAEDVDRDYFMDAAEAVKYGIVDKVLT